MHTKTFLSALLSALLLCAPLSAAENVLNDRTEEHTQSPQTQEDVQDTQPETQTGAFARIRAEAPGTAAEPDVATGAVPIAPARSKLGERGVGQRVRTYTSVSTGFIPLVREVHNAP